MGRLSPYIEANRAVVSKMLIPHLESVSSHPACVTCLRLRKGCECLGMSFTTLYDQLRDGTSSFHHSYINSASPGVIASRFPPLTRDASNGAPLATAWSSTGSTSLTMGWTPPGQLVFPSPAMGNAPHPSGQVGGALPSRSRSCVPPVRQTCPTIQSQQPHYQATPYTPSVEVPRRVSFAPESGMSTGTPSYYSDMVKNTASKD